MKNKKNYSSEEKIIILREHLEKNVPVSELAEKYGIHPNAYYNWQKQLFEEAPQIFARKKKEKEKSQSKYEQRITELEGLLSKRESLITDLVEDSMALKKKLNGTDFTNNGLNRTLGIR
jgi:transposase-like protein